MIIKFETFSVYKVISFKQARLTVLFIPGECEDSLVGAYFADQIGKKGN